MFIQQLQRGQPNVAISNYKSVETATTITKGQPVVFDVTTSGDGFSVTLPVTIHLMYPAGLVVADRIAPGDYGKVQTGGLCTVAAVTGSPAVVIGDPLKLTTASAFLSKEATAALTAVVAGYQPHFLAGAAQPTAGVQVGKVFVNC